MCKYENRTFSTDGARKSTAAAADQVPRRFDPGNFVVAVVAVASAAAAAAAQLRSDTGKSRNGRRRDVRLAAVAATVRHPRDVRLVTVDGAVRRPRVVRRLFVRLFFLFFFFVRKIFALPFLARNLDKGGKNTKRKKKIRITFDARAPTAHLFSLAVTPLKYIRKSLEHYCYYCNSNTKIFYNR